MSIYGITPNDLRRAALYVEECAGYADIHTVTLITNGQHGGIDVRIDGTYEADGMLEVYERTYVLS